MPLNRTPLYETHAASGAKLVDFGGWEMPLNYGSQIEEHHAVRRDAGMFDVSHMRPVDVEGADARAISARADCKQRRQVDAAGQGVVFVHAERCRRRRRRSDRLLTSVTMLSMVVNASTAEKDVDLDAASRRHARLQGVVSRRGTTSPSSRCKGRTLAPNSGRRVPRRAERPRSLLHFLQRKSTTCLWRAPATPAKMDLKSCCPRSDAARAVGRSEGVALPRPGWVHAIRCGWKLG